MWLITEVQPSVFGVEETIEKESLMMQLQQLCYDDSAHVEEVYRVL